MKIPNRVLVRISVSASATTLVVCSVLLLSGCAYKTDGNTISFGVGVATPNTDQQAPSQPEYAPDTDASVAQARSKTEHRHQATHAHSGRAGNDFCSALSPIVNSVKNNKFGNSTPSLPGAVAADITKSGPNKFYYSADFYIAAPQSQADFQPFTDMEKELNAHVVKCFPKAKHKQVDALRSSGTEYNLENGIYITVFTGPHYRKEGGRDGSATTLGIAKAPGYFL